MVQGQDVLGRCPDLNRTPALTGHRIWGALLIGTAIMTGASLIILSDSEGYRAGFEAATAGGVQERLAGSAVMAQPICEGFYRRSQDDPLMPRYGHAAFLAGCSASLAGHTGN